MSVPLPGNYKDAGNARPGEVPETAPSSTPILTLKGLVQSADPLLPEAREFVLNYSGETDLIDFKEDFAGDEREWLEVTKDILAFTNTLGGYLVFGVKDGTHEKKGIDEAKAALISDPSDVQAKVNRFVEPHITTVQCVAVKRVEDGFFYVFMHVPASKDKTHIVTKSATFKDKSNKDNVAKMKAMQREWKGTEIAYEIDEILKS